MAVASLHIPVTGASNAPDSATSISHRHFQGAAPIPKVPASRLVRHTAQAGKGSHAACPAMSGREVAGRVKLRSTLWDRGCRHTHGELAVFRASEWELVSCTSWRGLSTPRT